MLVALAANALVGAAKTAAALVTGSASMLAEAAHSWADTGNELFLFVAERKSKRPADALHPLGYGREAYVWSMFAAVGLFVAGAVVAVWHGVQELWSPSPVRSDDYGWAYLVLAVSFMLEGISFMQALRSARGPAGRLNLHPLRFIARTSNPTLRAVFLEDAAALAGILIAALGIALHQWTGNARYDALGSILVGLLLAAVAFFLIQRNHDFLIGEAVRGPLCERQMQALTALPGVARVAFMHMEFVGPLRIFLVAGLELQGDRTGSSVARTLRELEKRVEEDPLIEKAVLTVAAPEG
ncbi:MAG: cation diffusion facilitator family transporter [Burkholderiales bacterium]